MNLNHEISCEAEVLDTIFHNSNFRTGIEPANYVLRSVNE